MPAETPPNPCAIRHHRNNPHPVIARNSATAGRSDSDVAGTDAAIQGIRRLQAQTGRHALDAGSPRRLRRLAMTVANGRSAAEANRARAVREEKASAVPLVPAFSQAERTGLAGHRHGFPAHRPARKNSPKRWHSPPEMCIIGVAVNF